MILRPSRRAAKLYRLRAGASVDSYGDPVEGWATPSRVELRGATWQPVTSTEAEGVAERIVRDERALFVPSVADLTIADRVEIDGQPWRVDGEPVVRHGRASTAYTTATLRRISG